VGRAAAGPLLVPGPVLRGEILLLRRRRRRAREAGEAVVFFLIFVEGVF